MNKKEILLGTLSGFLANTAGTIFSIIILFQEINISNISRIVSNSISDNFITKLISLGAVINLIVFLFF
uniref:Membrane protein n=1 Tax=uncultured Flavobacteriia bacterium TaxID=212695 RepID=F4MN87_9BACT|nr:membrane protein [uncultured Flavobacteriia bacterium]